MTTPRHGNGTDSKIVELIVAEDRAQATALARYWDATVRGQPVDPSALDAELAAVAQLLRHYHAVTRHHLNAPASLGAPPGRARALRPLPARPMTRAALTLVGLFVVLFALNTLLSPRSWLLSSANDPDWIPWVSDDWLGSGAVTAHALDTRPTELLGQRAWGNDGA